MPRGLGVAGTIDVLDEIVVVGKQEENVVKAPVVWLASHWGVHLAEKVVNGLDGGKVGDWLVALDPPEACVNVLNLDVGHARKALVPHNLLGLEPSAVHKHNAGVLLCVVHLGDISGIFGGKGEQHGAWVLDGWEVGVRVNIHALTRKNLGVHCRGLALQLQRMFHNMYVEWELDCGQSFGRHTDSEITIVAIDFPPGFALRANLALGTLQRVKRMELQACEKILVGTRLGHHIRLLPRCAVGLCGLRKRFESHPAAPPPETAVRKTLAQRDKGVRIPNSRSWKGSERWARSLVQKCGKLKD
eukprot:m.49130 g.49130  ORF g.49130 m.49130 type:complete len:302 (-) comp11455_c0_seq1:3-908(-)